MVAQQRASARNTRAGIIFRMGERPKGVEFARKGSRVPPWRTVSSCARGRHPSASVFDPAAPARSYGDCSARADRNRWPRGGCGVCALWHFRLGDRALDRLACGRRTARGQCWSPMLADSEARRCFLFGTWRSAVAELVGNSRSQQLAAGQPSDVLAFGASRSKPLAEGWLRRVCALAFQAG